MSVSDLPDPSDRLDSWKEIAAFLGRTVRTVQRWEKTAGLPVRRGGPGRGTVVASRADISEWWQHRQHTLTAEEDAALDAASDDEPVPPPPSRLADAGTSRRRARLLIAVSAVAAAAIAAILIPADRDPLSPTLTPRLGRLLAASTSEGQSLTTIPVGGTPSDLEIARDDSVLYTAMADVSAVAVVQTSPFRLSRTIPTVERGWVLELSPDGRRLYVGGTSEVGVIDLSRDSTDRIPVGGAVHDLLISPNGRTLWVALAQGGLNAIDTASGRIAVWPVVGCPVALELDSTGRRLIVVYQCGGPGGRNGHDAVEILDIETGQSLLARSGPPLVGSHVALSPDGQYLWAEAKDACFSPQYDHAGCPPGAGAVLHTFRFPTLEALATLRVPAESLGGTLSFVPDGTRLLLSATGLHVVNAALGHVEESFALGNTGQARFARDASRLFVTIANDKSLGMLPVTSAVDARDITGLGMHWTGDGTANDSAGGGHAVDGLPGRYVPGRLGQAFLFDGLGAPLSFGKRLDVDPLSGPATFAAWIKPDREAAMTILSRDTEFGWQWGLTADGRPAFCLVTAPSELNCDQSRLVGRTQVAPGSWHHVAVVKAADRVLLYVDANLDAEVTLQGYEPVTGLEPSPTLRLGADTRGAGRFAGLIDEVTTFRRALSPAEIRRLMEVTSAQQR